MQQARNGRYCDITVRIMTQAISELRIECKSTSNHLKQVVYIIFLLLYLTNENGIKLQVIIVFSTMTHMFMLAM